MATSLKNLSKYNVKTVPSGKGKKIGIVISEWNQDITFSLKDSCIDTLIKHNVQESDIYISFVPGSYELPLSAQKIFIDHQLDAVICLGCVIKGETKHNDYINQAVAQGLIDLNLKHAIPFIFGVLTPNDMQQAIDRAGGKHGNKGVEAAITALKMLKA